MDKNLNFHNLVQKFLQEKYGNTYIKNQQFGYKYKIEYINDLIKVLYMNFFVYIFNIFLYINFRLLYAVGIEQEDYLKINFFDHQNPEKTISVTTIDL